MAIGPNMEGYGYEHFGVDGERDSHQMDYRRIVGDTELPRPSSNPSPQDTEHLFRLSPHGHGHGHETAAQRYSATRIQAGFGPER